MKDSHFSQDDLTCGCSTWKLLKDEENKIFDDKRLVDDFRVGTITRR
jgi:hypothetical protein